MTIKKTESGYDIRFDKVENISADITIYVEGMFSNAYDDTKIAPETDVEILEALIAELQAELNASKQSV